MALVQMTFESRYLSGSTNINVILPDLRMNREPGEFYTSGKKYPVLWLLHGTYGDCSDWLRKTNIELFATERKIIVVMPSALNSNYTNWPTTMLGYGMYDYLVKELFPLIHGWFPASDKREDNFIAGLSMGGRGTMKYALNAPELFAAAAVLSAAPEDWTDMRPGHPSLLLDTNNPRMKTTLDNAGGVEAYKASGDNLWRLFDEKVPQGVLPRFLFAVGTEDKMICANLRKFEQHAKEDLHFDAEFWYEPGYEHEWRFWNIAIERALDFFGIKKPENPWIDLD